MFLGIRYGVAVQLLKPLPHFAVVHCKQLINGGVNFFRWFFRINHCCDLKVFGFKNFVGIAEYVQRRLDEFFGVRFFRDTFPLFLDFHQPLQ